MFRKPASVVDIEDMGSSPRVGTKKSAVSNKRKRTSNDNSQSQEDSQLDDSQGWREALGRPPPIGETKVSCIDYRITFE